MAQPALVTTVTVVDWATTPVRITLTPKQIRAIGVVPITDYFRGLGYRVELTVTDEVEA